MEIFFHHVGDLGVNEDFPKTIFKKIDLKRAQENLGNIPNSVALFSQLKVNFPDGFANAWGIPAGAYPVVRAMKAGDLILLVDNVRWSEGSIRAMGIVKVFFSEEMTELSKYLWGENRYPFVFFFDTEKVDFSWIEFLDHTNYKKNWNPRGWFYRLDPLRLTGGMSTEDFYDMLKNTGSNKNIASKLT